jgi:RNA polymerase sigma factor for flagellar operon FliA
MRRRSLKSRTTRLGPHFSRPASRGGDVKPLVRVLVDHYYPLVRTVAKRMCQKLAEVTEDELASMGVDGLYDSIQNFDPSRNTKFETYAMHRIRGSMLDAIRKADWIPRLVRAKCAWMERKRQFHESDQGRRLSNSELAEKLNMTEHQFEHMFKVINTPSMHSANDLGIEDDEGKGVLSLEHVEDSGAVSPMEPMLRRELFNKLMGKNFTPLERKIIWLYYFEDLSMKEISDVVELSESRVSQMHTVILKRLKQKADRNPEYFKDIWAVLSSFKDAAPTL